MPETLAGTPGAKSLTTHVSDLQRAVEDLVLACANGPDLSDKVGEKFDTNQKLFMLLGCIQGGLQNSVPGMVLINISSQLAKKLRDGTYMALVLWVLKKIVEHLTKTGGAK